MRPNRTFVVPVVLALSACTDQDCGCGCPSACRALSEKVGGVFDCDSPKTVVEPTLDPNPERPHPRSFVAKVAEGKSCPAAPAGWVLEPPVEADSNKLDALMARYCTYHVPEPASGDPPAPTPAPPSLEAEDGVIVSFMADYASVLPQSLLITSPDGRHVLSREHLGVEFKAGPDPIDPGNRPYVAIVDTAEAGNPQVREPRERHGLMMKGIVNEIRCSDGDNDCKQKVFFEQAFPRYLATENPDTEARGTVSSLNKAVIGAVEQWRSMGDGRPPLVLNMSVGWEWSPAESLWNSEARSKLLKGEEVASTDLTLAEEALFVTLTWASCQGVLSVAAAGNTRSGACDQTGMMAPAAWEALPTPSKDECEAVLEPAEVQLGSRLVYAAGGVDGSGAPIINARPNSSPGRELYSTMTPSRVDSDLTNPWTGTSVATAALSAFSAQLWSLDGYTTYSPSTVMSELDNRARTKNPSRPVPLIRGYETLDELYVQHSPPHPDLPDFPTPVASGEATLQHNTGKSNTCTGRTVNAYAFDDAEYLAEYLWPELDPQPIMPICPSCPLAFDVETNPQNAGNGPSRASLTIDIDDHYASAIIGSTATLELHEDQGVVTRVDLDLSQHCPSSSQAGSPTGSPPAALELSPCKDPIDLSVYTLTPPSSSSTSTSTTLADYLSTSTVHSARLMFLVTVTNPGTGTGTGTGTSTVQVRGNEIDVLRYPDDD